MKILNIHKNLFYKIIGICAILFFAISSQKDNPDSIGSLINKKNITHNSQLIKEQGSKIINKTIMAKNLENNIKNNSIKEIIIIDEVEVLAGINVKCNDLVDVSIEVRNQDNKSLYENKQLSLNIGSNNLPFIEQKIIGMSESGVRVIIVPKEQVAVSNFISQIASDIKSNILLRLHISKISNTNNKYTCL